MSKSESQLEFLKLVTGEQIVGKTDHPNKTVIRIYEPLIFETGASPEDLSRRYVYMSRYVPFLQEQVIDIELGKVVFHGPPSASISRYYEASLAFCKRQTDSDFESCLNQTSAEMETTVNQIDMESAASTKTNRAEMTGETLRNIFLAALPTANSVH